MHSILRRTDLFISKKTPFISVILKGIGQIMLQENSITGLLFLIGISIGSYTMGIATIVSVISGNSIALLLKYDKKDIRAGLYGFSSALVGVALMLFYKPQTIVWIALILGSMASAMLQHFFIVKKKSVFTLPFVLITWIIMYIFNNIHPIDAPIVSDGIDSTFDLLVFPLRGIGQVIFQEKLIVGFIFLLGIIISSPIAGLYAILGSLISGWMAGFMSMPMDSIFMGLFSYNAVLCSIVFADKKVEAIGWVAISVVLSLLIAIVMSQLELTQLTFPFVLASIITLDAKIKINKRKIEL